MNKILIVSDADEKTQVNGVCITLKNTKQHLEKNGYEVLVVVPSMFKSITCPTYPEIKLAINPWKINKIIKEYNPNYIHIATEGPLGYFARKFCIKNNFKFSSSYHTKFPEYVHKRFPMIKEDWLYSYLRKFHNSASKVLVTTGSMKKELEIKGFNNLTIWNRGVDTEIFKPTRTHKNDIPNFLYVGRVSIEKNLEAFLNLEIKFNHRKIIVGDGPLLEEYKKKYPKVYFKGNIKNNRLAYLYNQADVFIFPSLTDTFGIVMIESAACGTPVAGFPVTGPIDFVKQNVTGYLDNNLELSIKECLKIDRKNCANEASKWSWAKCTEVFINNLVNI